jgi:DNA-binding response OmpR family regulator
VGTVSKKILIVEDENELQELIKIYIRRKKLDVEVFSAYTGEDGVNTYKKLVKNGEKPDVVIMDLKLPGIDGVETTKRILKIDKNAKIYGFTAFFETDWAKELKKAGAKDIIPRAVGIKEFINYLKKILQQ